ncbi:hypothetical protein ASF44_28865 [Pseudorhodoferax sp. Leaf274]|nr:hypothetical protein ASF44_28865 [Pseudorhodoferax sp. Leaf274]
MKTNPGDLVQGCWLFWLKHPLSSSQILLCFFCLHDQAHVDIWADGSDSRNSLRSNFVELLALSPRHQFLAKKFVGIQCLLQMLGDKGQVQLMGMAAQGELRRPVFRLGKPVREMLDNVTRLPRRLEGGSQSSHDLRVHAAARLVRGSLYPVLQFCRQSDFELRIFTGHTP